MPSLDLNQGPQAISRYGVVGKHAASGSFVTHVGLYDGDDPLVESGQEINAAHMRPPLEQGSAMTAHVAGHIPLKPEEIKEIAAWIEEVADEYRVLNIGKRRQYVIAPPWKDWVDANTGVRRYRRYSCAGFVLASYRQVEIDLLVIDEDSLPEVDLRTIGGAYPGIEDHPTVLCQYGLEGDGPWRVVLAGHVLHSLNRSADQIRSEPYQAQPGDERFGR